MTILFPALAPTSRDYTPPKWPTTSLVSQSGVSSHRIWANVPSQGSLKLSFNNILDAKAVEITDAYDAAKGTLVDLYLPPTIFDGALELYNNIVTNFDKYGIKWYFSSSDVPSPSSVIPGICNINVSLVAEIRIS